MAPRPAYKEIAKNLNSDLHFLRNEHRTLSAQYEALVMECAKGQERLAEETRRASIYGLLALAFALFGIICLTFAARTL